MAPPLMTLHFVNDAAMQTLAVRCAANQQNVTDSRLPSFAVVQILAGERDMLQCKSKKRTASMHVQKPMTLWQSAQLDYEKEDLPLLHREALANTV